MSLKTHPLASCTLRDPPSVMVFGSLTTNSVIESETGNKGTPFNVAKPPVRSFPGDRMVTVVPGGPSVGAIVPLTDGQRAFPSTTKV